MIKSANSETLERERQEVAEIHREAADGYVRLVMIVPATAKQLHRIYFSDSAGTIRHVTCGLSYLDRPSFFLKQVRGQLGLLRRHWTENLTPRAISAAWKCEVVNAGMAGNRFLKKGERKN